MLFFFGKLWTHRFPEHQVKQVGVNFELGKDCERGHRIGRRDQRPKGQALSELQGWGVVIAREEHPAGAEAIKNEPNEQSGKQGAYDGVSSDRSKVRKEVPFVNLKHAEKTYA